MQPARFSLFAGGGGVVSGRPRVEVMVVVLASGLAFCYSTYIKYIRHKLENTHVETITVLVVVTGAGVTVAIETLVVVLSGIEMKELQNFVAEALTAGLWRMLRTSDTTEQAGSPRTASSPSLFPNGLEETRGAIDAKSAERKMRDELVTTIAMLSDDTAVWKLRKKCKF